VWRQRRLWFNRECELVHICPAWRQLFFWCWGFQGPSPSAAGTRYFEPHSVAFCGLRALPDETIRPIDEAIYPRRRRHPETNEGY
jgi:hypothetical protein